MRRSYRRRPPRRSRQHDLLRSDPIGTTTDGIGARSALEGLLDEPVALKRIGILGYGATARAILAELHDNDAYTFVWGRNDERVRDACRRFEATPWPATNPPEIVLSTLPPDVALPDALLDALQARRSGYRRQLRAARDARTSNRTRGRFGGRDARSAGAREFRLLAGASRSGRRRLSTALAEREGFEPSRGSTPLLAFQASAFNRSTTSP